MGFVDWRALSRSQSPYLGDELLVHLASHVACQLAADVAECVFTCLVGVKIVSSEHRTTGGDGAVLGGSLCFLAGVVARLVQAPGVGLVDALLDVVEGCEEWKLNAGADCVVQTAIGGKDAGCVEGRLLEDFFLQVATKWCASCQTGDRPDVAGECCIGIEVPLKDAHRSGKAKGLLEPGLSFKLSCQLGVLGLQRNDLREVSSGVGIVHSSGK